MKNLVALVCGILFGVGLSLSGMTNPNIVLGFLDLFGHWNPALIFVMGSAVPITFLGYRLVKKVNAPLCDSQFHLPTNNRIDKKLVIGALLFGVGWGLLGLCPGPAIASLAFLQPKIIVFVICMTLGMLLMDLLLKKA